MRRLALLTLILALGAPAAARAGLAEMLVESASTVAAPTAEVRYTAAPGEANRVTATNAGGVWTITDDGAPVKAGDGCVQLSPNSAGCGESALASPPLVLLAGDLDDVVSVPDAPQSSVFGGAGNDTLTGSPRNDSLNGGPGNDRLVGAGGSDALSGGPGDDELAFSGRPSSLSCGAGIDVLKPGRGIPLLSAVMPRDCERVQLGALLTSVVPSRQRNALVMRGGCDTGVICRATLSLALRPSRGAPLALDTGNLKIAPGKGATLSFPLGPYVRNVLARDRGARLQVGIVTRTAGEAARRTGWRLAPAR